MTFAPAVRASITARMISAMASSPALASCSRTPPVSNRISTGIDLHLPRGAQQADQLGAMHLAEGAAHEASFLRGNEHGRAVKSAAPDDDAVVELLGKVEYLQMRADLALLRPDELDKAAGVEQQLDPCSRRCLVEAGRAGSFCRQLTCVLERSGHWPSSSINRTACARRSDTVSGRAPPSLMENFSPPGE